MILLGITWPGKRVTGLSFILEFFPEVDSKNYLTYFTLFDYPDLFFISVYYQFVNPDWYPIQAFGVGLTTMTLIYC